MDLLWVRHGEPERIAAGTGVPANPALTALGREQAERLAAWLAAEPVDIVLSSPQRRARETAEPIARVHGLEVEVAPGLMEYDAQSDHYIPMEELRATNDPQLTAMYEGRWEQFGAEPADQFRTRISSVVDEIVAAHAGQRVVAVCHGGVINVAFAIALGLDRHLWFEPHYTSLSRMIASRTGVRSVASLNERAHLDGRREPA
ncbi:MAG TPA: histidine phosphatase family protein [Acidimicrobiia bacterium]|nr:histidine phosphatase family protein [Acidimicrobiia bacterium]